MGTKFLFCLSLTHSKLRPKAKVEYEVGNYSHVKKKRNPVTSIAADNDVIDLVADVTTSGCVFCRDVSKGVGDLILDVVSRGK